jgi:hypothetical protein
MSSVFVNGHLNFFSGMGRKMGENEKRRGNGKKKKTK